MRIGEFLDSAGLKQKRELRVSGVARHHRGAVVEVMTNRWVQSTGCKHAGERSTWVHDKPKVRQLGNQSILFLLLF
jgi:hypothetical protein